MFAHIHTRAYNSGKFTRIKFEHFMTLNFPYASILFSKICMVSARTRTYTKCNKIRIKSDYGGYHNNNGNNNYMKLHAAFTQSQEYLHYDECCPFYACLSKCDVMLCMHVCIPLVRFCRNVELECTQFSTVVCIQIHTHSSEFRR